MAIAVHRGIQLLQLQATWSAGKLHQSSVSHNFSARVQLASFPGLSGEEGKI